MAKYIVEKTRDFRGTLGLRHKGDVVDVDDILAAQLIRQGLLKPVGQVTETETIKVKDVADMSKQDCVAELISVHGMKDTDIPDDWNRNRLREEVQKKREGGTD